MAGVRTRSSSGAAATTGKAGSSSTQKSLWLAADPSKRWAEVFYLAYSPFWIIWALCVLVPFQLYEHLDAWGYLLVGLAAAVPCFALPPLLVPRTAPPAVTRLPWHQQFWVKANLWVLIFGYVGNYFWTHYFYQLLGAAYTIPSFELNAVPLPMYLMTHAYFLFYHALSNVVLRRVENALAGTPLATRKAARAAAVFALAYATAYGETLTIAHFPYYTFVDRAKMYTVGSLFYALYFFVSFPMFMRLDEDAPGPRARRWTLPQIAVDALGASMLVTILLDTWRITFGGIVPAQGGSKASGGLMWAR